MTRSRERVRWSRGGEGVELLEAEFDRHVYDRHVHDTYAIGITLRGVQRFWCRGATHDSTPGHVIMINPGEAHDGRSGAPGGYAYRMFYIQPAMLEGSVEDVRGRAAGLGAARPILSDPVLSRALDAAWNEMACSPTALACDELLHRSLGMLAARCDGPPRTVRSSRHDPVLKQVCEYLHERIEQVVTMRELSALASLSRFQLTRLFQKAYGVPLHAYHLHLRLEEAKRRLARGQAIATVATDLQFVDQSHLHRRFKGSFGMTPGQWRAAHGYKTPRSAAAYAGHDRTDAAARCGVETIRDAR